MLDDIVLVAQIAVKSSLAVLFAGLGELVAERSGVLNLGVEGMMLVGALAGFAVGLTTGDPFLAFVAAGAAGMLLSLLHAFFAVLLGANQVLSGLSLTLLGMGLTSLLGRGLVGLSGVRIAPFSAPLLADIPLFGTALFHQPWPAYAAYLLLPLVWFVLFRTHFGLRLRAVGQGAEVAHAAGVPVRLLRTLAVLFGGFMAGLGGGCLSLAYTPGWAENMTGGQGWIALALVIFASWRPFRLLVGALLFGGLTALQFYFQAAGVQLVPAVVLRMLPYLLTIAVLILVNRSGRDGAPADLGRPFLPPR